MKKTNLLLASLVLFTVSQVKGQNVLPTNGSGSNPKAFCGIGIGIGKLPTANLQIHGATTYTRERSTFTPGLEGASHGTTLYADYGVTGALTLTNTYTGTTESDGAIIRMSVRDFAIDNLESGGNISLAASGANMLFQGTTKNVYTGGRLFDINSKTAAFNIFANDVTGSALNIATEVAGNNGLTVQMANNNDNALQVHGKGGGDPRNFSVKGSGEVFARKYTTTLQNIPDYVFEKDYKLLTFSELKTYIEQNKHLPNIPSAKEYTDNGVDLGEMNRLLLEKTEEQTLYILQLEERMKALEAQMQLLLQPQGNK